MNGGATTGNRARDSHTVTDLCRSRTRADPALLVRLRATLAICLLFRAVDLFATALNVDPGVHPRFQIAIVGSAVE
jgi:hypothetical protein